MAEINWQPVAKKLEDLIKKRIISEGLVKTGKLLNSIKVVSDNQGGFTLESEDYFKYLDKEYHLLKEAYESPEFTTFLEDYIAVYIEKELEQNLNKNF